MNNPQLSIISPIYNMELYLKRFIESVISQSFTNWELLLIDDGSTDRSKEICDSYAQKDDRIIVIQKENGGVSSARNVGIKKSSGEWILFADSDDEIADDGLSVLMNLTGPDVDLVTASYNFYLDGQIIDDNTISPPESLSPIGFIEAICNKKRAKCFYLYCWHFLFKSSFVKEKKIFFREDIHYREFVLYFYNYITKCKNKINCSSIPVYNYFQRSDGSVGNYTNTFSYKSASQIFAITQCYEMVKDFAVSEEAKNYLKENIFKAYLYNKQLIDKSQNVDSDLVQKVDDTFYNYFTPDDWKNYLKKEKNLKFKQKYIYPVKRFIKRLLGK